MLSTSARKGSAFKKKSVQRFRAAASPCSEEVLMTSENPSMRSLKRAFSIKSTTGVWSIKSSIKLATDQFIDPTFEKLVVLNKSSCCFGYVKTPGLHKSTEKNSISAEEEQRRRGR